MVGGRWRGGGRTRSGRRPRRSVRRRALRRPRARRADSEEDGAGDLERRAERRQSELRREAARGPREIGQQHGGRRRRERESTAAWILGCRRRLLGGRSTPSTEGVRRRQPRERGRTAPTQQGGAVRSEGAADAEREAAAQLLGHWQRRLNAGGRGGRQWRAAGVDGTISVRGGARRGEGGAGTARSRGKSHSVLLLGGGSGRDRSGEPPT
jgi:hypothetical protein